jgi:uroporphyrinogen-III synthase
VTPGDVLVLRPQPGADETVAALRAAGFPARALPVLAVEPLPETPALRARVQDLDRYDAVIFVSPAAVRVGMRWIDRYWPQYPLRTVWIAVGARTAEELAALGLAAVRPETDERAEGLLALAELAQGRVERVLIVRGEGGRELLVEALTARGASVDLLEVYRRRPLPVQLPPAEAVAAAVASSGEVLDAFLESGGAALVDRPLLVPSERVAERARAAGFRRVRTASGAGPAATVAALEALEGSGGAP